MKRISSFVLMFLTMFLITAAKWPAVNTADNVALSALGLVSGVSTNAALKAISAGYFTRVIRRGFYAAGDSPEVLFYWSASACTLNAGAGDNGSQIAPNTGMGCWIAKFSGPSTTPLVWGAIGDGTNDDTTAVQAAINATINLGLVLYFDNEHKYKITGPLTDGGGIIRLQGSTPVGNSGTGSVCPGGIYNYANTDTLVLTGPTAVVERVCLQLHADGGSATAGRAIVLNSTLMDHAQIVGNTVFRPYDGIVVGDSFSSLVRDTIVSDNVIRSPSRVGLAIGRGTTNGGTAGITAHNNRIGCDSWNTGNSIGFAFYDGAVDWDGTTVGPNNCYIGTLIAPGTNQNVNGIFRGVLGDSSGSHYVGGGTPHELWIKPTAASAYVQFLTFIGTWTGSIKPNTVPLEIDDGGATRCGNIKFIGHTAHSGTSIGETTPFIARIAGCDNIAISGSTFDQWPGGGTVTDGVLIVGKSGQPRNITITGGRIGYESIATNQVVNGITLTADTSGNLPAYVAITGVDLQRTVTPINVATAPLTAWRATFLNNIGVDDVCSISIASANTITIPAGVSCVHITGTTDIQNILQGFGTRRVTAFIDSGLSLLTGGATLGMCNSAAIPAAAAAALVFNFQNGCWSVM